MGQIVRRRKKGRPSKADLARRSGEPPSKPARKETDVRRSLRRRNVKYNIDYDDYDDYFTEDDDEEEERRREKKVKLVEKLDQGRNGPARGSHAHESGGDEEEGEEDDDDESERKPLKKRKINDGDDSDKDDDESDGGGDDDDDCEERSRKPDSKLPTSHPGTPSDDPQTGIPLPDKKTLELILDKLQKKDTYGVYAEPVDPEELPDYHDVIKHPMDFATVRKQLADGSYSTLEQFEGDVFLICSNAMEYNSSDTIYYKQACSIQELAKKRFERLRIDYERSEKELKIVQKTNSNSLVKKQTKKPMCRTLQDPIGSDFSSGATLATAGDVQNSSHTTPGSGCERPNNTERPSNTDRPSNVERPSKIDGPVEGNSSLNEATTEKAEDMSSGKGLVSKAGRKSSVVDENRRGTYNISSQPVIRSESIFTTFDGEIKQFVAVGLHAEYSYARSLARFSGSLGPIAWKVASKRIEQALPDGCKFGRGWVGEYEPLPTPVLMVENCTQNQSAFSSKFYSGPERKDDRTLRTSVPFKEHPDAGPLTEERQNSVSVPTSGGRPSLFGSAKGHYSEGKPSAVCSVGAKPGTTIPAKDHSVTGTEERQHSVSITTSGGRPSLFGSSRGRYSEGKSPVIGSVGAKPGTGVPAKEHPVTGPVTEERQYSVSVPTSAGRSSLFGSSRGHHSEGKPAVIGSVGAKSGSAVNSVHPRKNAKSRFVEPENKVQKEVELNSVPSLNESNANLVAEKQLPINLETAASRSRDTVSKNMHLQQPVPFKMPESNGVATRGLPNGKSTNASLENQKIGPSVSASGQMDRTSAFFPHGQEQGLSDPVQLMKKLAEKTQKQPKSSNPSSMDTQPVVSSVPTISRDDSSNAAAAAARAWMSIGAGAFKQPSENLTKPNSQISADSLYNPAREFQSQISRVRGEFPMQFQSQNSFSFPSFLPQAGRMGNEGQFQNRPTVFPQLAGADLSRFQVQSAWQGFSPHAQPRPRQKQESLPPDLNIGFQSPGSPVKQSSGLMVDSQQPDLALQL